MFCNFCTCYEVNGRIPDVTIYKTDITVGYYRLRREQRRLLFGCFHFATNGTFVRWIEVDCIREYFAERLRGID